MQEDKITSFLVPSNNTVAGLLLWLIEKLHIYDPLTEIELKFKVLNMNIPSVKICENEAQWWNQILISILYMTMMSFVVYVVLLFYYYYNCNFRSITNTSTTVQI